MEYTIGSTAFTNWKIIKELGEGATGKVFEIHKTDYGITTKSALKVIRVPHSSADLKAALAEGMDEQSVNGYFKGFVDEIVKEIVIMSKLKSHPNIVSYEDHQVTPHKDSLGWDILIRMELLTPLLDYQLSCRLAESDVIRMGRELTGALVFCHGKGLMHRDIKPENIFVSEAGQFKLGDFGVARTVEKTTGGLSRKGTEKYMAPEVYLGNSYNKTADLYSLGLVLYSFLNRGRLPFYPLDKNQISFADRETAMDRRMRGDEMSAPSDASAEIAAVILKACAYQPKDRYETAKEMLSDLEKVTDKRTGSDGVFYTEPEEKTIGPEYTEPEEKTVGPEYTEPEEKTIGPEYTKTDAEKDGSDPGQEASQEKEEKKIPKNGKDIRQEISIHADTAQKGGTRSMVILGKSVVITIPARTKDGQQIRLRGLGEPGVNGGTNGDAYITVHIQPGTFSTDTPAANKTDDKKAGKKKKLKWGVFGIVTVFFVILAVFVYHHAAQQAYEEEKNAAFSSAKEKLDAGAYGDAIDLLTDLTDQYPEDYRGYEYLAEAYEAEGQYQDALDTLSDGMIYADDGSIGWPDWQVEYFDSEYDRISKEKEYSKAIAGAQANIEDGNIEQAQVDYETAIGINPDNEQAYEGMVDLYIGQGKYDEGVNWLEASGCGDYTKVELKKKLLLSKVNKMMNDGDYKGLFNFFKTERASGLYEHITYYYQDGKIVDNIEEGKGLILSTWGVYSGDIVNGKREGNGTQFGTYSDEDKIYTLTEGMWSGDKANGKCTYTYKNLGDERETSVITGNVKDNMFDGDLTIKQKNGDGQDDTFSAHADNGTYSLIRNDNGEYVYMESKSGWYGYYDSEEDLKGRGVWDAY